MGGLFSSTKKICKENISLIAEKPFKPLLPKLHEEAIASLCFAPNFTRIISGGHDKVLLAFALNVC